MNVIDFDFILGVFTSIFLMENTTKSIRIYDSDNSNLDWGDIYKISIVLSVTKKSEIIRGIRILEVQSYFYSFGFHLISGNNYQMKYGLNFSGL